VEPRRDFNPKGVHKVKTNSPLADKNGITCHSLIPLISGAAGLFFSP
jgi:hypothetical protein